MGLSSVSPSLLTSTRVTSELRCRSCVNCHSGTFTPTDVTISQGCCVTLKFAAASSTNRTKISTWMFAQSTVTVNSDFGTLRNSQGNPLHPSYSSSISLNNFRNKNIHLSSLSGWSWNSHNDMFLVVKANKYVCFPEIHLFGGCDGLQRQTASFLHSLHPQEMQHLSKGLS